MLLKACLNGTRSRADHPAVPVMPDELAADGAAAVAAGAAALHVHPRDGDGNETLAGEHVAAAVTAMRAAVSVPVGVTTGAWFMPDPDERLAAVRGWRVRPDFASVNFHEEGAAAIASTLLEQGIGVEAGLWTPEAAEELVRSGLADRCLRVLLEPFDQTADAAVATADAIEAVLVGAGVAPSRLLHGFEATAWAMVDVALANGLDIRIGLEDTLRLPDGTGAAGNAALVEAAVRIGARGGRRQPPARR
jgi:uncharacterized protein (DUF849 family)